MTRAGTATPEKRTDAAERRVMHEKSAVTRRQLLLRGIGGLLCAAGVMRGEEAWGFPGADMDWSASSSLKGLLGQVVVIDANPYTSSSRPRGFVNWRPLVQIDVRPTGCWFNGTVMPIQKAIRLPYATYDELVPKKKEQVIEHVIIGFASAGTTSQHSTSWNKNGEADPDATLDRLGHFLVRVMQPADSMAVTYSSATFDPDASHTWNGSWESGGDYTQGSPPTPYWNFRQRQVTLERIARVPYTVIGKKTDGSGTSKDKYFMYIGFEGGGSY